MLETFLNHFLERIWGVSMSVLLNIAVSRFERREFEPWNSKTMLGVLLLNSASSFIAVVHEKDCKCTVRCTYMWHCLLLMLVEGLTLKIHPLERPNIVDILERLQEISLSRNVSPKQPLSSLVATSASPASASDPVRAGMWRQNSLVCYIKFSW